MCDAKNYVRVCIKLKTDASNRTAAWFIRKLIELKRTIPFELIHCPIRKMIPGRRSWEILRACSCEEI